MFVVIFSEVEQIPLIEIFLDLNMETLGDIDDPGFFYNNNERGKCLPGDLIYDYKVVSVPCLCQ